MKRIRLSAGSRIVHCFFQRRSFRALPNLLEKWESGTKLLVVSDRVVSAIHGKTILKLLRKSGFQPEMLELPGGETCKNLQGAETIYRKLCEIGANRKTPVVAFGGGVITDLAGFAASTFMRGLPFVSIPTTLLAQADAAIGGKTGINLPQGKNLVGTFYHPDFVLIDPEFLETLPEREFRNGLAEIVKMSLLAGKRNFFDLERLAGAKRSRLPRLIDPVLFSAIREKILIVKRDPYEKNVRAVLNLGHTFAHALEAATNYRYSHGQAVAIGLVGAAFLAEKIEGFPEEGTARIENLLRSFDLPARYGGASPREVLSYMGLDKKKKETLRFVLPVRIGKVALRENVSEWDVLNVLERLKEG